MSRRRRAAFLALAACLAGGSLARATAGDPLPNAELGKRMYREGMRPSGAPLHGTVEGDVPLAGNQGSCAGCHGRSGFGAGEGGRIIPPVAAPLLFQPSGAWRTDPRGAQASNALTRPAYDERSLARAIREGIDPRGRRFDALMPRYALDDAEMSQLLAYLESLSAAPSPGVTEQELRFATVVGEGVDPSEQAAMLDVLTVFFRNRNAETRGESARKARGSWDHAPMFQAFRRWELDVWQLTGPPAAWPAQLEARYEERPVFAMIGGLAAAEWRPIHEFCEARELPCVLPETDLPPEQEEDYYSIYFSRGVRLEADVLVRHLEESGRLRSRIVQVRDAAPAAEAAARHFEAALALRGGSVRSQTVERGNGSARLWQRLLVEARPEIVVAWLPATELAGLAEAAPSPMSLFLSSTLADPASLPAPLVRRALFLHPYVLEEESSRGLPSVRRWLARNGLPQRAPRVEANTYFAASLVGRAVKHIQGTFSREYFLETIEHQIETSPTASLYPQLSLGRGQRFASKGAWVARAPDLPGSALTPVSGFLVP
jgi:mono/diheme cytochrome c family protein